jgi:hypothetical protein
LSDVVRSFRSSRRAPALAALIAGSSVKEAAAASGVDPRTVNRWLSDPEFASQLTEGQAGMLASAQARLSALTDLAVDVLEAALRHGDVTAARWHLEGLGLLGRSVNLSLSRTLSRELPALDLKSLLTPAELEEQFRATRSLSAALQGKGPGADPPSYVVATSVIPSSQKAQTVENRNVVEISEPPPDPITAAARRVHNAG